MHFKLTAAFFAALSIAGIATTVAIAKPTEPRAAARACMTALGICPTGATAPGVFQFAAMHAERSERDQLPRTKAT
ncbi:hypothetical protein PQX77_005074 [Marasmius sp. AFHP31]|nr:hypothetical protein PQX77_005074 [Marasmius sp. AFHP31]